MLSYEEIRRLEQVWLVLSDLFQDLNQRNICVNVASDLRNCKTLTHFIRTNVAYSSEERLTIADSFRNLVQILRKIRSDLISAALRLDENYAKEWIRKVDKAERAELDRLMIYATSEFVPGLPRDHEKRWARLTLRKPIAEEQVQDIAEQAGVTIEFKDECRILISGWGDSVRKAVRDIYELSLEQS